MMMNNWNSVIFMKSDKSWSDICSMSKWEGVEDMWSTTGEWDWCIKLDSKCSTPEKAEEFVNKMRQGHWAKDTQTHWWKQVDAK